jgi:hypothetical protein
MAHELEAILEHALTVYHADERHDGADRIGDRVLDDALVPIARAAFQDADELPDDDEILRELGEPLPLLGEGYHVIALAGVGRRFVVKYAKHPTAVPPLADPVPGCEREWERDHAVRDDGSLHPAIWQHVRAFEAYGSLAVPSRVYLAESACQALSAGERRALERYRAIGIVRSLGDAPRPLRVDYPDGFPREKRAPDGVLVSAAVVQPMVTPLATAIDRALRAGDVAAARDLEARYEAFTEQLWRCGVSHLDFSILNIGLAGSGPAERLLIFDPHLGSIDGRGRQVQDPMRAQSAGERPIDHVLRSSRDGSRWALWRVQQQVSAAADLPPEAAAAATDLVRDFHAASEGLEEGRGSFGVERFDRKWQTRRTHSINAVMHAQLWRLLAHPLGDRIREVLDPQEPDAPYDRSVAVLGMDDEQPLAHFRAGLKVHADRPLLVVVNAAGDAPEFVKHWGRLRLPPELDVQDDPAIHYHLRDLFTGEVYVRSGDDLARGGFVIGLAPKGLHVLEVEDVAVEDLAAERSLAAHRDISRFLGECSRRVGVVGDVHGERQALHEILAALGFIDAFGHWSARDGTLVFTGDIGHGRHLQDVFDFIHELAGQAHRVGGHVVWTLGNHDLYLDREGGQGGSGSLGYRLWPQIREAALHPERHPGLNVQAAYFAHGKLFVHGGILPNIVALALHERGAGDAETVAEFVNDVLRETLVDRERISARDLPHEIFHVGTSHTRERRMPGEAGYEPAGVFTPDLRELDHFRYHDVLLPQVVGHTASATGAIRYAPGSWLRRDYIAVDVGRQHGAGNGGLLLTDFGWVAVTPGGPARFVEVTPLFVDLARASADAKHEAHGREPVTQMLAEYFKLARPTRRTREDVQEALFTDLSPAQVVALEHLLAGIRATGRCAIVTDLDAMLTAFAGTALEDDTVKVLAAYLAAGGVLAFSTDTPFDWFYARLLSPLIVELGGRSGCLSNVLLVLSGGKEVFACEAGAFRLVARVERGGRAAGFDALVKLAEQRRLPVQLDPARTAYVGDSTMPGRMDSALAGRVGIVVDLGDAVAEAEGEPLVGLHHGYRRMRDTLLAAAGALRDSGAMAEPTQTEDADDTVLWTFAQRHAPPGRRLRVRVDGSGFVHAGVERTSDDWEPIYNVPLVPLPDGGHEAVLPMGVNAFTFFWTEAPWTPGHPGHWERRPGREHVFRVAAG